jgi:putative ABC transport system permease protein
MKMTQLAARNLSGNPFRSWVVGLSALLVASFALATTLILRGAQSSLQLTLDRLGADIIIVPRKAETKIETALLMGIPEHFWMPADNLKKIAAIPGVAIASPQLYLSTLTGASCCSVSNMFLIAFDPSTDFTVRPWLEHNIGRELTLGEAVGGQYVFVPPGEENIKIYGYFLSLKGNMEPTGTGLDQTLFFNFDTAYDVARKSNTLAESPLEIPTDSVSAVMVKVAPGSSLHEVAVKILQAVPDITPIESTNLFQSYRAQISGLLRTTLIIMVITWALCVAMITLIFSMAANERRRELGVLRALGATPGYVLKSLLAEAGLLALIGAALGVVLTLFSIYLFHNAITLSLGLPFLFPSLPSMLALTLEGLAVALGSVTLAALIPALRISRMEPAIAMRE